jgi:hypothetical protein
MRAGTGQNAHNSTHLGWKVGCTGTWGGKWGAPRTWGEESG